MSQSKKRTFYKITGTVAALLLAFVGFAGLGFGVEGFVVGITLMIAAIVWLVRLYRRPPHSTL